MKFKELIKNEKLLKILEEDNFTNPTEIQENIIPLILQGSDVLGQSQTGTGKTLAFGLPILENIKEDKSLQTLILAPTRELAIQIGRDIENYSKYMNIKVTCVYGSSSIEDQIKKVKNGSEIVVGTPGRVKDLINRRVLKLEHISYFVLDEADEMLSMGFQDDLEYIFEKTNKTKQVLLFSATMPKTILTMAKKYMKKDYKTISVISDIKTADHITQNYYLVNDRTRVEAMCRVMDYYKTNRTMIFVRTKRTADDLLEKLQKRGYSVDVIHGDITQGQRILTLDKFKAGVFKYLIATDVAARGIHVDDVNLVVNYNLPESNEYYVHRIGRTGRANKSGIAVTFVKNNEESRIRYLEKDIKVKLNKCVIPVEKEIIPKIVENVINETDKLTATKDNKFGSYLETKSMDELKVIAANLLEREVYRDIGSDFNVNTEVNSKTSKTRSRGKRGTDDSVRVFLTIGKLDNISKKELLRYIEKTAGVREGTCTGVEIMTKFTFMNVKKEMYDKVFKKINNTRYSNRLIRMEIAKN